MIPKQEFIKRIQARAKFLKEAMRLSIHNIPEPEELIEKQDEKK